MVVAHKLRLAFTQHVPVAQVLFVCRAAHFFLVLQRTVVLLLVGGEAVLAENQLGQVQRESVRIFQREYIHAADLLLACFAGVVHQFVEQCYTFIQRTQECFFFALDNRSDLLLLLDEFGISVTHIGYQLRHQFVQERLTHTQERITVTYGTAQNTADHISGFLVARQLTVGDRKSNRTYMVGNNAHRHIGLLLNAVLAVAEFTDLLEHRLEHIRVVVRLLALYGTNESLEAHTGINHFLCQRLKRTVSLAVELHEYDVPNLDNLRMVFVHQFASGHLGFLLLATAVHMDLRARSARTRVAHLPEVVVLVAVQYMIGRQVLCPNSRSLIVTTKTFFLAALKYGGIQVLRINLQYIHDILPRKVYCALLEVVAERPVAEHLEHCVVVRIMTNLLQIVVLAADAQTLLAVCHTRIFDRVIAEDDTLPRVHAGVGKHQCRVILDDHRSRGYNLVTLACHKI